MENRTDLIVIGGGASGLMAAGQAAAAGAQVAVLEKNAEFGKKILITGKGRCNVTNDCDMNEFQRNMPGNGRFLFSAFSRFDSRVVQDFFTGQGVPLKVERGRRVFPVSDRAEDIRTALERYTRAGGVRLVGEAEVEKLQPCADGTWAVHTAKSSWAGSAVVVATGGASYPATGSTGDGFTFARNLGHTVKPLMPSLVPLETVEPWVKELQGLTLKNVGVVARGPTGEVLGEDFGELLFTHFGISGPTVLTLSRNVVQALHKSKGPVTVDINLKPALSEAELDGRLQREFSAQTRRQFKNIWKPLLPRLLIPIVVQLSGVDPDRPVHQVSRTERQTLVQLLQALPVTVQRSRPLAEAVVTMGGVSVREVLPATMASRLHEGLFFCGEVLDIDGYTGGYNLQAAFSTGAAAGEAAASYACGCQRERDGI